MAQKLGTKAKEMIMNGLEAKKCLPIDEGTEPLSEEDEFEYLNQIHGWSLNRKQVHQLRKLFQFMSFTAAVEFVNRVARIAEEENHHPDLLIHGWNHVRIELYTHTARGLSENDFIMAARFDPVIAASSNGSDDT